MKGPGEYFGTHRVISPEGLLPQAADKIDNTPDIWSNEILIDVIALQPTSTAVHSIKDKCGDDIELIKKEFLEIVENRGKFQDPVTKSGGMLIGKVKQIGTDLIGKVDLEVGDKIATLVSLSLTPLKIYEIISIDLDTEQVVCKADAVLFESGIFTKIPDDLGEELSLAVMDIAGAPAQVAMNVNAGETVVVMGAGKAGLLCLAEAKKRVAPHGKVVCMEYSEAQCQLVRDLGIADVVLQVNGQKPLETYNKYMQAMGGQLADFTVSTVNVNNTELSTILVTKDSGKIYFFSMSTDFVKASLGAEGAKKYVTMVLGAGYYPGHAEIAFHIVRENEKLREYLTKRYCK
ncbi:MAG: L-erythro-3,5-diaminohexanoate dehydrogenase [Eubacteriales bacterium]|nr:L-erythro-3,5-diaminohexanoate dehydrogenase [Eubacteriales bacterium]